jgi:hypothetical protein
LDEEDEKAVAGGLWRESLVKLGNGLELGVGGPMVQGVGVLVATAAGCSVSADDGEGGLSVVVRQEKIAGGGDTQPGAADGAAANEKFRGKKDEDLPDDDLLREVDELHDRRQGIQG